LLRVGKVPGLEGPYAKTPCGRTLFTFRLYFASGFILLNKDAQVTPFAGALARLAALRPRRDRLLSHLLLFTTFFSEHLGVYFLLGKLGQALIELFALLQYFIRGSGDIFLTKETAH